MVNSNHIWGRQMSPESTIESGAPGDSDNIRGDTYRALTGTKLCSKDMTYMNLLYSLDNDTNDIPIHIITDKETKAESGEVTYPRTLA